MALVPENAAADINTAYQGAIQFPPAGDFPADVADAYDSYAAQGTVIGAVNSGGDAGIIEAALRAAPTDADSLGQAFADYWATVALTPAPGNTLVVNDALAKAALFVSAVEQSITDSPSDPPFEQFIKNIEDTAVKSVIWTVTSSGGGTTTETIA